ncbi:MAG: type II toxin-antitoxin system VapC family toxin [Deltaproteobacteria bacterium]|nr:type II toxin-antitoxin system VapC family toxin [Deltaproteobacteria bacterium]
MVNVHGTSKLEIRNLGFILSKKAKRTIESAVVDKNVFIASISAWEIALLASKKRLLLSMEVDDWIKKSEMLPFVNFIPVDNSIAVKSVNLSPPFHSDPADRIIIATAISLGASLITKDERILEYPHVKTIW